MEIVWMEKRKQKKKILFIFYGKNILNLFSTNNKI